MFLCATSPGDDDRLVGEYSDDNDNDSGITAPFLAFRSHFEPENRPSYPHFPCTLRPLRAGTSNDLLVFRKSYRPFDLLDRDSPPQVFANG
jgi:hypothetical protein